MFRRRRHPLPLPAVVAVAALLAAVLAPAPARAVSTLRETLTIGSGPGFRALERGPGEGYRVRRGGFGSPRAGRAARRRSLAYFGQLTDPQLADETSPARVEFIDPAGGAGRSSHRPQETMDAQTFDATVRAVDDARRSPVRARGGRHARMGFAITTGDLADNQQLNETRWFLRVLDGGRLDPFSGRVVSSANPCPGTSDEEIARLNADVAARRYTGVQDYGDYPGRAASRYAGFWDPDEPAPVAGQYSAFPRYPGLLERAQRPFTAAGLRVPWFISRGNHDGLVQGNAPASTDLFQAIAVGCLKVLPSDAVDPESFRGAGDQEVFRRLADPAFLQRLLAGAGRTAPDPDRRFVGKAEYKALAGHGFTRVDRREEVRSKGTASYYAFTRDGIRFVSLDTVAEGGGQDGNLDDAQFRWLERELRRAERRDQLVIAFGHHTLGTMDNTRTDEQAGKCDRPGEPGCDADPRRSTPLHLGLRGGSRSVRALFLRHPHLIAYVAGHTHENRIRAFRRPGGRSGFWEVNTASHVDWPQQARTLEVVDDRDGNLSLFATVLDQDGTTAAPAPGTDAAGLSDLQLAGLSRVLAANDPQFPEQQQGKGDARGSRGDRNVELIVRDPRRGGRGARGGGRGRG